MTAAIAGPILALGGLLGGLGSLRHVVSHLSAYTAPCPKADLHACFGYAMGHSLMNPLLYIVGGTLGGLLAATLAVVSMRAVAALTSL